MRVDHSFVSLLVASLFLLCWTVSSVDSVVIGDKTNFFKGSFIGYLSPWGAKNETYIQNLTADNTTFPNNSLFAWSWPAQAVTNRHITGYNLIGYGQNSGGRPPVTITPRLVGNFSVLTSTHDTVMNFSYDGVTCIYDLFLTTAPTGTIPGNKLFEIEIFLHFPPFGQYYFNGCKFIGNVTLFGIDWMVRLDTNINDILVAPANLADVPRATIDFRALFDWLLEQKVLNGSEWYAGHQIGIETSQGSGTFLVKSYTINYVLDASPSPTSAPSASGTTTGASTTPSGTSTTTTGTSTTPGTSTGGASSLTSFLSYIF